MFTNIWLSSKGITGGMHFTAQTLLQGKFIPCQVELETRFLQCVLVTMRTDPILFSQRLMGQRPYDYEALSNDLTHTCVILNSGSAQYSRRRYTNLKSILIQVAAIDLILVLVSSDIQKV